MKGASSFHEDFAREHRVKSSSNRSFGLVFAGFFLLVGLLPLARGAELRFWALGLAAAFLFLALAYPAPLSPLNRLWLRFGLLLHRITTPLVMGLIFFLAITPTALLKRAVSRDDPMRRRFEPEARSYWIERRPPGPAPETMRNQF